MDISTSHVVVAVVVLAVTFIAYRLFFSTPKLPPMTTHSSSKTNGTVTTNGNGHSSSTASNSTTPLHPMSIFFGSQSGTAETFARELAEEAKLYGFTAAVKDLEDYDADELLSTEKYAVFLMATFGEGEPTDNSASFYEWLCNDARTESDAAAVPYAVFALGNRQYEHFCLIGRVVDEKMAAVGGKRVVEHGEGDDDGSLEDDFRGWKKAFWTATNAHFGTSAAADGAGADNKPYESAFVVTPLPPAQQAQQQGKYVGGLTNLVTDPKHRVVVAPCVDNRELRQSTEDDGSTRHIELDLNNVHLSYLTADNCGVYPRNDYKHVAQLLKRLQLDGKQLVLMKGNGTKRSYLPSPVSVQDIFLYYLDISFTPRLSQLPMFNQYTTDEADRLKLQYYCGAGQDEYIADHKTFLELLEELPSILPPLSHIVDWMPRMAPRFYTISSSSLVQPKRLALTVSVLTHHKPRGRKQQGICSSYLASLRPDKDAVAVFIRPSSFRLPRPKQPLNSTQPVVHPPILMIGPGTGVAPFRGFIQEATYMKQKELPMGDMSLFFGCRASSKDFIYKDELLTAASSGVLAALHTAFSRERVGGSDSTASETAISPSTVAATTATLAASFLTPAASHTYTNKVYVQDRVRGVAADVWEQISARKGHVYVCGGTAMGRSVREVLLECCKEAGGMTDKEAEVYVKKMQEQKRYIQELWS